MDKLKDFNFTKQEKEAWQALEIAAIKITELPVERSMDSHEAIHEIRLLQNYLLSRAAHRVIGAFPEYAYPNLMRYIIKQHWEPRISLRALNVLRAASIETIEQLSGLQRADLYRFRNVGRKTVDYFETLLNKYGYSFRP